MKTSKQKQISKLLAHDNLSETILVQRIRDAVLDMMSKVKFDEKEHLYTEVQTGSWLQGVSEVSSIIPKDWLSAWGAKEAVKALGYSDYEDDIELATKVLEHIAKFHAEKDIKGYISFLKEAKGASARKSKEALVDGKKGHEWLETYVKAKIRGEKLPKIPTDNLKRPIKQFLAWEKENVDYWILSEARVCRPDKKYAGTLDSLAMLKNGHLALIDFKFASHISEDYHLQTSGYLACFEPYNIPIQDRVIIRLPKTLEREEWDSKTHKYSKVENNLEVFVVDTPYEFDRDTFYAALPVKRWINSMQQRKKVAQDK